jgi:hypothetical protein
VFILSWAIQAILTPPPPPPNQRAQLFDKRSKLLTSWNNGTDEEFDINLVNQAI